MRIVSLIASSTEIVHALGLGKYMVGRSHECDYPQSVKSLPICTGPKFAVDGSSYEIDQRVKAILQESLSVYKVDAQILDDLSPSHIITQAQCDVCAVSLKDVEAAACEMVKSHPAIISLEPNCLEDYFSDLLKVGRALDCEATAQKLIDESRQRIENVRARAVEALSARREAKQKAGAQEVLTPRTVAVVEWIEPLMAAGNWMPELVELCGGINLFGIAGKHSPWMTFAELIEKDPDVIVVTPCGFDNERTLTEMHLISGHAGFRDLKAAKTGRVYIADGNQYFNRPGPRLVDSLEIMAEMIYPEIFAFGHENKAWLKADLNESHE
ncbi:MAG: cobalamin-binding protein [Cyanobacteria bacterium REEB67]|nr:cobalamin-binding protein [Cyanobacteria bacterium REEB67]